MVTYSTDPDFKQSTMGMVCPCFRVTGWFQWVEGDYADQELEPMGGSFIHMSGAQVKDDPNISSARACSLSMQLGLITA